MSIEAPGLPTLSLEHAFDVTIWFDKRWQFGPISGGGEQGYTSVKDGSIEGPMFNGRVVEQSGADWAHIRPDGVIELNAHYMFEHSDGTRVYIRNLGYVHRPLRAHGQGPDEEPSIPGYFRCTPYFRAPEGPHGWLNRTVIVGSGVRRPGTDSMPDHSLFRYWAVR